MIELTMAAPSGSPRNIPTDQNGSEVSVEYFWQDGNKDPVPAGYYTERLLHPSGVLYGVSGRELGAPVDGIGQYREAILNLDVHAMTRDDGDETLAVAIETSFDSGQNWHRIAGFNTVSTTGKTSETLIISPSGAVNTGTIFSNLNATRLDNALIPSGVLALGYFGDMMRTSSEFIDPAGADASGIFSVYAAFKK